MFLKILRTHLPLILIFIVASFTKLYLLDKIPNAIGGDELVYVVNAKSLFLTGHDIFGSWTVFNGLLFQYPTGEIAAELPYLLFTLIVGILPFSLFAAHLTNALLTIFSVLFVYLIVLELVDKKSALWAAFIASINPWFIYIGRTAYEAIPAMFFYLIAIYILIKAKGSKILLSFPFFLAAFYSYIGTKIILVPLVIVLSFYCYFVINKKKFKKEYISLIMLSILVVLVYFVSLMLHQSTSRIDELLTPNSQGVSQAVDNFRSSTIHTSLTNIFINKFTIFINIIVVKTLASFSLRYLFIQGDEFFSIWRHGLFYYVDAFFIAAGSLLLFTKKRILFVFISVLMLICTIPQSFHSSSVTDYSLHLTMLFPFLVILTGIGISFLEDIFKNKTHQKAYIGSVLVIYFISLAYFLNIYFYWFPLRGYFDMSVRLASNYVEKSSKYGPVYVYSDRMYDFFKKYIFYSNSLDKNTASQIGHNLNLKKYQIGNVTVLGCDPTINPGESKITTIYDNDCQSIYTPTTGIYVPRTLEDPDISFKIYNDKICKTAGLKKYPSNVKMSDLDIEKLSAKDFCSSYIISY